MHWVSLSNTLPIFAADLCCGRVFGCFWDVSGSFLSSPKQLSTLAAAVGVPGSVANLPVVHLTNPGLQRCGPWLRWGLGEMKDMKMERIQIWGVSVCVCYMLDDVSIVNQFQAQSCPIKRMRALVNKVLWGMTLQRQDSYLVWHFRWTNLSTGLRHHTVGWTRHLCMS